jgi:hypothetical protein
MDETTAENTAFPVVAARIPQRVADEAREMIARIREADDPRQLRREGAEGVVRLTEAGLEAFFLRPVEEAGLGAMTAAVVKVGLKSAAAAIAVFVRRVVGGLSAEQMRSIAELVDERVLDLELEDVEAESETETD